MAMKNSPIETKNYDFGFFTLLSSMSFRSNYSTAWEMRWLFCNVKIFTWLKVSHTGELFFSSFCIAIESALNWEKFFPVVLALNQISNLAMMFDINASSRSIFFHTKKLSPFDNLDRRFMWFEICREKTAGAISKEIYEPFFNLNFL
jgi:hypothetical protein